MNSTHSSSYAGSAPGALLLLPRWSKYFALITLATGTLVIAGWTWHIDVFKRPIPHLTAMNPLTALCFVFAASSFLLLVSDDRVPRPSGRHAGMRVIAGRVLAVFVLAAGLLRVANLPAGSGLRIDQLIYARQLIIDQAGNLPNEMTIHTAFSFFLTSLALLLLHRADGRAQPVCQYLALLIALTALFSLIGYLYRVRAFYGVFSYIPMSVHTSTCFLLVSMAILFAYPDKGIMKELTGDGMGAEVGRSLLPFVILLPILLGYIRLMAFWEGLISTEFGVSLLVASFILTFSVIVWVNTRLLNRRDQEKQAAEKKLLEIEERFALLVSSVKDYAIFMLDPAGRIISWNEGAERIKGYKKEEIIGRHMSIFYTPSEIKRGEPHYNLTQAKEYGHFEQEGERVRKDGSVFWASIVFTALRDPEGRLVGFAKVTRDITQRKLAEEKINYLARLMEDTSDAIFSTDSYFLIRTWNKAAESLYGYSIAEVRGQSAGMILRTEMNEDMISTVRGKLIRNGYWKGEVYYLTKAGNLLTILLSASAVKNAQGRLDGFVMVCRDFTERKKLELQLQQFNKELEAQVKKKTAEITDYKYALDQSSIVSITDEKGVITYVNENFCRISGYTAAELIGQRHDIIASQHHPAEFFQQMWLTISKGEVWKGEIRNTAKDGSIYWVDMTIVPFLNEKKEPYEYLALDSDITERKKAEELLSRSYQDIRQLASHLQDVREEERAGIAREIHDELGQQLTGLKMDLSWITKRKTVEEDTELRQKTITLISLLDTTIKTVRRISTNLRPSILDDLGLVAAIEWQSQEFERRSGICTEFASTITEFSHSSAIAIGLFRICQESLTNIARHAAASKIRISLQEEENEYILLKVADNGNGFEVRGIGDKKTLGLLGMKERALMMGGEFRIESQPGKGTILSVTVPITIA